MKSFIYAHHAIKVTGDLSDFDTFTDLVSSLIDKGYEPYGNVMYTSGGFTLFMKKAGKVKKVGKLRVPAKPEDYPFEIEIIQFFAETVGKELTITEKYCKIVKTLVDYIDTVTPGKDPQIKAKMIKAVISHRTHVWKDDPKMSGYLTLATVLGVGHWDQYYDEALNFYRKK
jgi:hypothetical protein